MSILKQILLLSFLRKLIHTNTYIGHVYIHTHTNTLIYINVTYGRYYVSCLPSLILIKQYSIKIMSISSYQITLSPQLNRHSPMTFEIPLEKFFILCFLDIDYTKYLLFYFNIFYESTLVFYVFFSPCVFILVYFYPLLPFDIVYIICNQVDVST